MSISAAVTPMQCRDRTAGELVARTGAQRGAVVANSWYRVPSAEDLPRPNRHRGLVQHWWRSPGVPAAPAVGLDLFARSASTAARRALRDLRPARDLRRWQPEERTHPRFDLDDVIHNAHTDNGAGIGPSRSSTQGDDRPLRLSPWRARTASTPSSSKRPRPGDRGAPPLRPWACAGNSSGHGKARGALSTCSGAAVRRVQQHRERCCRGKGSRQVQQRAPPPSTGAPSPGRGRLHSPRAGGGATIPEVLTAHVFCRVRPGHDRGVDNGQFPRTPSAGMPESPEE